MAVHEFAGKPARAEDRENIASLVTSYYQLIPDVNKHEQQVSFGTSGHRGNANKLSFNERHILAIVQAVAEYRAKANITGPLYLGKDTHALSEPAFASAISVLVANGVDVCIQSDMGFTPTPVISRLIIIHNRHQATLADGLIITPSHNPPCDGGIKYNPPHGGPAQGAITSQIEKRANDIIANGMKGVKSVSYSEALNSQHVHKEDFIDFYVTQLNEVINFDQISAKNINIGVDPLGGSGIDYWPVIAQKYNLNIEVVNKVVDSSFSFMPLDKDGKIRMDCSSPYAMAGLIELKDKFDIAVGNDPDFDRHGIVTKQGGLMNPNHYLAVSIYYLMTHRNWSSGCQIGKTLVSSSLIDRVAKHINKQLSEVPVGFKWFVDGLKDGTYAFAGEESAGATFIEKSGQCWTTDKDGFVMTLLAAEIVAETRKDPYQIYQELVTQLGQPVYGRNEAVANREQKQALTLMNKEDISVEVLAGEKIVSIMTNAPGNNAAIGGVKVSTENGWFAARPSGTEDIYKIYAESFIGEEHLQLIFTDAQEIVNGVFAKAGI